MESYSISFTLGKGNAPHGGNVEHNSREFYTSNRVYRHGNTI